MTPKPSTKYLLVVGEDGVPVKFGPYPFGATQKERAREWMKAGKFVLFLDVDFNGVPTVGNVLLEDGNMKALQKVSVKVEV